ncbi:MAG: colanic acid biosynthesis glycosyltransferase WcaL, partial [Elusimicrobia bacterium]|nr:colanic acid biosynthesis glycosyltransferase WcaL [Elusimicrobiota bacterium]
MALGARAAPSATAKIHYVTTQGVSDVWVASELRVLQLKGIPFELHAMRRASAPYQRSDWALELHRLTRVMYPLSPIAALGALLAAPFLFGRRFWAAAHNALFGERESVRARVAGLAHFLVACWWARAQRGRGVAHVHSQWIHSGGTIAMYGAWLLDTTFSFTGHAADLFRDRVALRDKIHRAKFIVCIST